MVLVDNTFFQKINTISVKKRFYCYRRKLKKLYNQRYGDIGTILESNSGHLSITLKILVRQRFLSIMTNSQHYDAYAKSPSDIICGFYFAFTICLS